MTEKKRPPTSGTRKGTGAAKGAGLWGRANGMGWGGPSRASGSARPDPLNDDERARLRAELLGIYLQVARDESQPPMLRMAAAEHLIKRLDNPFDPCSFEP